MKNPENIYVFDPLEPTYSSGSNRLQLINYK